MNSIPSIGDAIIDAEGRQTQLLNDFFLDLNNLFMLSGSGSPEGIVKASKKRLYMDELGSAGSVLYIKRDDSTIPGNQSTGWVLV